MAFFNWILLASAGAVLAVWQWIKSGLSAGAETLDGWLDPVLSPVLAALNLVCTRAADGVYAVVSPLPIWAGLALLSAVTGVIMLVVFRYASNQAAIGRAKDDIKANLLALKLFKDDLGVAFRVQGRLFCAIVRLQRYMLTPILIMLLPMLLGLAQMGTRYQWRPLNSGERTLIKMKLDDGLGRLADIRMEPSPGAIVEVGPVPGGGTLVWRIRAGAAGRHTLRFHVDGDVIEKELVVVDSAPPRQASTVRVSAVRVAADWSTQLFQPIEPRLPPNRSVKSIEIDYPGRDSWLYGSDWWVLHFFVVSMLTALTFKPLFKVKF